MMVPDGQAPESPQSTALKEHTESERESERERASERVRVELWNIGGGAALK